jgi:hypothetical protein
MRGSRRPNGRSCGEREMNPYDGATACTAHDRDERRDEDQAA